MAIVPFAVDVHCRRLQVAERDRAAGDDGLSTCDPDKAVGLRRELSSIQAAVKYMNDKFCKTRAF